MDGSAGADITCVTQRWVWLCSEQLGLGSALGMRCPKPHQVFAVLLAVCFRNGGYAVLVLFLATAFIRNA